MILSEHKLSVYDSACYWLCEYFETVNIIRKGKKLTKAGKQLAESFQDFSVKSVIALYDDQMAHGELKKVGTDEYLAELKVVISSIVYTLTGESK